MLTTDGMNWTGTYSQLYSELNETAESMGINTRQKAYPKNSQVLSRRLNELSPSLPAAGYRLTTGRSKEGRKVSIYSVHSVHSDTGDTMYANDAIPGDNTGTLTAYLKRRKAPPPTGDKKLR